MLGQPDPVVPKRSPDGSMSQSPAKFGRPGFVSLWVGGFPSVEEAEAYFGIPDEIGVCLPAVIAVCEHPIQRLVLDFCDGIPNRHVERTCRHRTRPAVCWRTWRWARAAS